MKKIQLKRKCDIHFIDYFIHKEKKFLLMINKEAFYNKDFRFYIGWFIYAIDDYMQNSYDIEKSFIFFFTNNYNLNIIFFTYIISANFRQRVMQDITEYKHKYRKEHIYD